MQSKQPSRTQTPQPRRKPNPDESEVLALLADVPAQRIPKLLQDIRRIAKEGKK